MRILGIETSCDETGAALVEGRTLFPNGLKILSNVVASSEEVHKKYGGIVPEQAARKQVQYIIYVLDAALKTRPSRARGWKPPARGKSSLGQIPKDIIDSIDAIAVTVGPGLIGSLLVGVETAKTLSFLWNKPLIPVNHLLGHIYSAWLTNTPPTLPAICLIVSGGHTLLVFLKDHGKYKVLGETRDDAAGEAFDKIARLLGFEYPGGPMLAKAAEKGNPKAFNFPRPMINSQDSDFSFSGLKTSVLRKVHPVRYNKLSNGVKTTNLKDKSVVADLAASVQEAIIDVLVTKTTNAVKEYKPKSIIIGGGVAANIHLREQFKVQGSRLNVNIHMPPPNLCTDNGAVIGAAAYFNYKPIPWQKIIANPSLKL